MKTFILITINNSSLFRSDKEAVNRICSHTFTHISQVITIQTEYYISSQLKKDIGNDYQK